MQKAETRDYPKAGTAYLTASPIEQSCASPLAEGSKSLCRASTQQTRPPKLFLGEHQSAPPMS